MGYALAMMRKRDNAQQRRREKAARARARKQRSETSGSSRSRSSTPRSTVRENPRFNRAESSLDHLYYSGYGFRGCGGVEYDGWIKCRLLHGAGYSLMVADQLYVQHDELFWIQPLAFGPNLLCKLSDTDVVCDLNIDVSCGHRLAVRFRNHDHVLDMADGSQLFKCRIRGPVDLCAFATGRARWEAGHPPYIELFHHTSAATVPAILSSLHFQTSPWNIQGSEKKLKNVGYAYFTPLDAIRTDTDLQKIAMAVGGHLELRRDGFVPPPVLPPDYLTRFGADILRLPVYQCDPSKREACINVWVDASVLAPQHVYRHDEGGPVYYELPHHFIHRIGTTPGGIVVFDAERAIHRQSSLKSFDYVVVGDCRSLEGLAAPYDEEDTTHILKIERAPAGSTVLDYWFAHGNTDLFTGKSIELQEFHRGLPPEA